MEKLRYYQLMDGIDANTEIRQYMDLDYLLRLLETRSYYVKQKQEFPDKHESRLPLKAMFSLQSVEPGSYKGKPTDITESLERIRKFTESGCMLTACWTERRGESALMWKNFTTKMGGCIKSTINNFVASFANDDYDICCGRMSYTGVYAGQDFIESLFTKDKAFEEEKEIRFYFTPKNSTTTCNSTSIPVIPDVMIDEIILSPYIEPRAREILRQIISEKYNLKVTSSKIELKL
jgi:hypothetical protein